MQLSFLLLFSILLKTASSQIFCSDFLKRENHTFYPLRHCQRSNKTQIGVRNVNSLEKCAQYAQNSRALAFNFGRKAVERLKGKEPLNYFEVVAAKEAKKSIYIHEIISLAIIFVSISDNKTSIYQNATLPDNEPYFNCQIMSCPEFGNFSEMINDTRYDYYSLYANPARK